MCNECHELEYDLGIHREASPIEKVYAVVGHRVGGGVYFGTLMFDTSIGPPSAIVRL